MTDSMLDLTIILLIVTRRYLVNLVKSGTRPQYKNDLQF